MNAAHELMKVHACLAHDRHSCKKYIHQKAFPTAHATPQINATRNLWMRQQLLQRIGALQLVVDALVVQLLQSFGRGLLRRVERKAALRKRMVELSAERHR